MWMASPAVLVCFVFFTSSVFVCADRQIDALIGVKNGLVDNGNHLKTWTNTSADPCSWSHVTCTSDNKVLDLELSDCDLSGQLATTLSQVQSLQILTMNNNKLSGSIPSELGDLSQLVNLDLYNNDLSGSIPEALGRLTNLQFLRLSNNNLSGQVPEALKSLRNLKLVVLGNNPGLCGWKADRECP